MAKAFDIIVLGAGLNGLAAAIAFGGAGLRRPLDVLVVDVKDPRGFLTAGFDGRATAISASTAQMFEALGVWTAVAALAQPIQEIVVTDARTGAEARPVLLRFEDSDMGGRPTAYMVENRNLYACLLDAALSSAHITLRTGLSVADRGFGPGLAGVLLADGSRHRANLLVAADGRHSPTREAAGIAMHGWNYGQTGIVATVEHELGHFGRAEEHFTVAGPFAILPLPGNRSSLVWTEPTGEAQRILALPEDGFQWELERRFGTHLGQVRVIGGRHGYPLSMFVAREFTARRLALVGDAAHVLHPLAGLGLNLGLRDVAALAECVHDAAALGVDPGNDDVLERYSVWRRFDTVLTAAAMDALNRLFANDIPVLRLLRDAGLAIVDRIPGLKSRLVDEAAGHTGTLPRLLRGERL
jgi:2-octaprenyl-6-methoxyphenol hydroxylase